MSSKKEYNVVVLLDNPFKEGLDPRVLRTLLALRNSDISVALICMETKGLPAEELIYDIPVYRIINPMINKPSSLISKRNQVAMKIIDGFSFKTIICNDQLMLDIGRRIKRKTKVILYYDSHEFFQDYHIEFPENTPLHIKIKSKLVRWLYKAIERRNIPKAEEIFTINQSIANFFDSKFKRNIPTKVIRNISEFDIYEGNTELPVDIKNKLEQIKNNYNLIFFGNFFKRLNGMECLMEALTLMDADTRLIIVGDDKSDGYLIDYAKDKQAHDKIVYIDRLHHKYLPHIGKYAKIAIIPTMQFKYRQLYYSLPNKIFDSIKCGLPLVCSRLPEHERIIKEFSNGTLFCSDNWDKAPEEIKDSVIKIKQDYQTYLAGAEKANETLNFTSEYKELIELIHQNT